MTKKFKIDVPLIPKKIDEALILSERASESIAVESPPMVDRMSSAGRCWRERWASFRGIPIDEGKGFSKNPQLLRTFKLGHAIEDVVVDLLEEAGFHISDQQLECRGGDGRWIGHIDGLIWMGEPIQKPSLLEVKSANAKRFDLLRELGYEEWNAGYAAQLQAYMHTLPRDLGVDDAIVAVFNKDTSELYFERILYDIDLAMKLEKQSLLVCSSDPMPPPRPKAAKSRSCKYCKWCDRSEWCWSLITDIDLSL